MIKIVTTDEMRKIERAADAAGISYAEMMQRAGRSVAEVGKLLLGDLSASLRVAVLVGPGNNGGDGLVAARILKEEEGIEVAAYLLKARTNDDDVFTAARDAGVFIANAADDVRRTVLADLVSNADLLIDALLGTGAHLPINGDLLKLLDQIHKTIEQRSQRPELIWPAVPTSSARDKPIIVAVDCPSGLNCDTGELDETTLQANVTVTFGAAKVGQLTFPGADSVGELVVADIGVPDTLLELADIQLELADGTSVGAILPRRPRNGHKGTFGRAVITAGSINYAGAAALCGAAAYRAGAGLVTLAVAQVIYPILAAQLPEVTWILLPHEMGAINSAAANVFFDEIGDVDALLIGPGLGREEETGAFLRGIIGGQAQSAKRSRLGFGDSADQQNENTKHALPDNLVIDADGLYLLADIEDWWTLVPANTVITPHPGEMSRLTGVAVQDVQTDRIELAREKAAEWGVVVVLKGAFTIVASPEGRVIVIPFASDALATAGTGDVLAGCITGLMAQGLSAFEAAVAGAYIHALAGSLAAYGHSTRSVVAGDVIRALAMAFAAIEPHS
jgi:ADP-dependent NAD(P)H-hydrate dehydratase / NAD(P)H-hydrate epimerase